MTTISIPKILLPKENTDMPRWSSVACDQFTAEPEYWETLTEFVGDAPSTLKLVFPEIYLKDGTEKRVADIHATMDEYIKKGIFREKKGIILVERDVHGEKRFGLMLQIDLEDYDWRRVRVPIRATEDTIVARLPVRVEIRRGAALEFPHAMLLIDDSDKKIIEELTAKRDGFEKLYDFDLNMYGGKIKGYLIPEPQKTIDALNALLNPQTQIKKYGTDAGIQFAVGDGNHSIASAKVYWEEVKKTLTPEEIKTHPTRFLLAEVVNIYGGGMDFEPIHRAIWGADKAFVDGLKGELNGSSEITLVTENGEEKIPAPSNPAETIKKVQEYIENALKLGLIKVDYIHNEEHLREVIKATGATGIIMPKFPQGELFNYVVNVGNLPKKAFSIGEPNEKRYYLEAKYIK